MALDLFAIAAKAFCHIDGMSCALAANANAWVSEGLSSYGLSPVFIISRARQNGMRLEANAQLCYTFFD